MANREMDELWNGPLTQAWVQTPDRYDGMLVELGELTLDAADLRSGERVLDVGCGSGQLTLQAAQRVAPGGRAVGVDLSAPLVARAEQRRDQQGADDVVFVRADVQGHDFGNDAFDVVVSRFGVMFFDDPVKAFSNVGAATVSGGRLAFVVWQAAPHNEWLMTAIGALLAHVPLPEMPPPGAPGPFAFGDADHVRSVLDGSGWVDVDIRGVETTLLVGGPGTVDDVLDYYEQDAFGRLLLAGATPEQRAAGLAALREAVLPRMSDEGLRLGGAVWVVTARQA